MGILRKLERAKNAYFGEYIDGVKHYNWHTGGSSWIGDFIRHRFSEQERQNLSVVSVFGTPRTFWFNRKEDKIFLLTNSDEIKMPNVIGYSKNDIMTFCNLLKIDCVLNGNGYVKSQSKKEGELVNKETNLEINLNLLYTNK